MGILNDLPAEILIQILQEVSVKDLQCVILGQRVSRRFRDVIHHAVLYHQSPAMVEIRQTEVSLDQTQREWVHFFLRKNFGALLMVGEVSLNNHTTLPDTHDHDGRLAYRGTQWDLTLKRLQRELRGDVALQFRRLPWVTLRQTRDVFLHPDASWRNLSPTLVRGPRISKLDVIWQSHAPWLGRNFVCYAQVEIPASGLTLELLYNILWSEELHTGGYGQTPEYGVTMEWQFLFGKSIRNFDEIRRLGLHHSLGSYLFPDAEHYRSAFLEYNVQQKWCGDDWTYTLKHEADAAILYLEGGDVEPSYPRTGPGDYEWTPSHLGTEPVFRYWQGCQGADSQ
ncbi:hypothetical protein GGR57DRAFT_104062 [Xylariaceae sp. FL1272]|nr:hypothetical protein GGR57DRAFT_104062 [Xylariaceae sp. FL1272]